MYAMYLQLTWHNIRILIDHEVKNLLQITL